MANLMSELERFEQEMKELGSEGKQSVATPPAAPPPPPPSPPPLQYTIARGHVPPLPPPSPLPPIGATANGTGRYAAPPLRQLPSRLPAATLIAQPVLSTSVHVVPATPPAPPPLAATTSTVSQIYSYSGTKLPISSYVVPVPRPPPAATSMSYFPVPFHLQPQYQYTYQQAHRVIQTKYQYSKLFQQPAAERTTVFPLHQQQQAHQLFQRDAQTITLEALESVKAALASGQGEQKSETKRRAVPRKAAGQTWEDPSLAEWPENDHRLFCGDLGNEVNDEVLTKAFARFGSFNMARVVRDKRTGKTKGFGFVSFANPSDLALAFKDMNGKYVGNRPIKLRKSRWKDRIDTEALQVTSKHNKRHKTVKPNKPNKKNILHK